MNLDKLEALPELTNEEKRAISHGRLAFRYRSVHAIRGLQRTDGEAAFGEDKEVNYCYQMDGWEAERVSIFRKMMHIVDLPFQYSVFWVRVGCILVANRV